MQKYYKNGGFIFFLKTLIFQYLPSFLMADEEAPLKGGDGDGANDDTQDGGKGEKKQTCGDLCEGCIIGTSRVR